MDKLKNQEALKQIERKFLKKKIPFLRIGNNVRVGIKIIEGEKKRVQFYEGTIIAKKK